MCIMWLILWHVGIKLKKLVGDSLLIGFACADRNMISECFCLRMRPSSSGGLGGFKLPFSLKLILNEVGGYTFII